jgi:hypothetical protein
MDRRADVGGRGDFRAELTLPISCIKKRENLALKG